VQAAPARGGGEDEHVSHPRPPWSWPMRITFSVLCLAAFVLFAYVMLTI
jgi:hypothetical protein